jgi:hypothetical protein
MPAYSFQERFIPFIQEGSKNCTVRALRLGRVQHVKPGETIQLYTGLRTKHCRKIGKATCSDVQRIRITKNRICFLVAKDTGEDLEVVLNNPAGFAWRDGFRPEGSTADSPAGAYDLMVRFISKNYGVPFEGVVIFWKDFRAAK